MKRFHFLSLIFLLIIFFSMGSPVLAQSQATDLKLRLTKVFGYSSLSNREFQGTLNLSASGPAELERVVFYIDGQVMGEVKQPPFSLKFFTDSYALGTHTLVGVGFTTDGRELHSNELHVNFVTAERGMQVAMKIVIPLLVVVFGAILLGMVIPALLGRGKRTDLPLGAPRKYGIAGGAICPRCGRPFALHFLAINLGPIHKLDRCPFCGKWGVMRRRSQAELQAAEAAELRQAQESGQVSALTEEEKLRREMENARYLDI